MLKLDISRVAVLTGCPKRCPVHVNDNGIYANTGQLFRRLIYTQDGYVDSDGRHWTIEKAST